MILNEEFYLKRGQVPFSYNDRLVMRDAVYIDPDRRLPNWQSSYPVKDQLKDQYGAKWSKQMQTWAWPLDDANSSVDEILNTKVKPALAFLKNTSHPGEDRSGEIDDIMNDLRGTVSEINNTIQGLNQVAQEEETPEAQEASRRLQSFKEQLVNAVSSEELENLLQPILDYGRSFGYQYSLGNLIAMYVQDPEATDVMAESDWYDDNRRIVPGAKQIWFATPAGPRVYNTRQDRAAKRVEMIQSFGFNSESELSSPQRKRLKKELDRRVTDGEWKHKYKMTLHYDIRFTEVIEGRQDLHNTEYSQDAFNETEAATSESKFYLKVVAQICREKNVGLPQRCAAMLSSEGEGDDQANIGAVRDAVRALVKKELYINYANRGRAYQSIIHNANGDTFLRQAEVCTWLVMKYLGYDVQSSINLMNLWKVGRNNVTYLFDTVANQAKDIYSQIKEKAQNMMFGQRTAGVAPRRRPARPTMNMGNALEESRFINLLETKPWTGLQLAEHFGVGHMYSKERQLSESKIKSEFFETLDKLF